eukprot:c18820_g1_i5 orf=183-569(+)
MNDLFAMQPVTQSYNGKIFMEVVGNTASCFKSIGSEVEVALQRISKIQEEITSKYAGQIPSLASMARSAVRELDNENDLRMLRIRSQVSEIIVLAETKFTLIVIQSIALSIESKDNENGAFENSEATK